MRGMKIPMLKINTALVTKQIPGHEVERHMYVERDGKAVRIAAVEDAITVWHGSKGRRLTLAQLDPQETVTIEFHADLPFTVVDPRCYEFHAVGAYKDYFIFEPLGDEEIMNAIPDGYTPLAQEA